MDGGDIFAIVGLILVILSIIIAFIMAFTNNRSI